MIETIDQYFNESSLCNKFISRLSWDFEKVKIKIIIVRQFKIDYFLR